MGAAAGIYVQGCDVMISGMPKGTTKDLVERYLKNHRLVGVLEDGNADCEVLAVMMCVLSCSFYPFFPLRERNACLSYLDSLPFSLLLPSAGMIRVNPTRDFW
jgi:hypothetical protein